MLVSCRENIISRADLWVSLDCYLEVVAHEYTVPETPSSLYMFFNF